MPLPTTLPSPDLVAEATTRYHAIIDRQRDQLSSRLVVEWDRLGSYNREDVARYEEATRLLFAAAKPAAVTVGAAFFAVVLGIRPKAVRPDLIPTTPDVRGPFTVMWHALKRGRPYEESIGAGRSAVSATGFDFIQSTTRRTGDYVAAASGLT